MLTPNCAAAVSRHHHGVMNSCHPSARCCREFVTEVPGAARFGVHVGLQHRQQIDTADVNILPSRRVLSRATLFSGLLVLGAGACIACTPAGAATAGSTPSTDLSSGLTTWDTADSVASVRNDLTGLARTESGAALSFSAGGARAAKLSGAAQPPYQHVDPTFAQDQQCLLVGASIKLTGEELTLPDFSEFAVVGKQWTLTNHVMLAQSAANGSTKLSGGPAVGVDSVLTAARQQTLAQEIFARTIGAKFTGTATVGPSALLDRQMSGGWQVYQQQLGKAKVTATRTLDSSAWGGCAASTTSGTLAFLTLTVTDTVAPGKGGPTTVALPASSPDLKSLGQSRTATGARIAVSRVESFLLEIPAAGGAVEVIGGADAPTAIAQA